MAEPSLVGAISEGRRVPAVTVFGWDDVLCPTTHAKLERNRRAESKQERIQLLNVGQSVVRLVRAAQRHGPVVIVTDSHEDWVRGTAELLLPGGAAAACLENVEVVSSRDRFAKDFPDQPACWQIAAFSYVTNRHLLSRGATDRFRRANAAATAAAAAAAAATAASGGGVEGGRSRGTAGREAAEGRDGGETVEEREGSADVGTACCATAAAAAAAAGAGRVAGASRRRRHRRRVSFSSSTTSSSSKSSGSGSGGGRGDGHVRVSTRRGGTLIAVATAPKNSEDKAAALTLREHHPNVVAKTVSLMEGPTPLELKNQLDLLADKFRLMFGHASSSPERPDSAPAPAAAASTQAPVSSPKVRRRKGGGSLSDDGDDDDDDDLTSEDDDDDDGSLLLRGAPAPSCGSSPSGTAAARMSDDAAAAATDSTAATPLSGLPSAFHGDAVKPGRLKTGTLEQGRHLSRWGYGDGDSDDYMTPPCSASTVSSNGSLTGSDSGRGSVLPGWASSASGSGSIPSPPGPLPAASSVEGPQS
ncbi:unnamed protein product [Ectocarpus sp. CCAP 1310/34]|nr:unnamed protein product [Ectocarpus sp. CCAP 1310/34]